MPPRPRWFLANAHSGQAESIKAVLQDHCSKHDKLLWTESASEVEAVVRDAEAAEALLVIVGGDGSVRAVVEATQSTGCHPLLALVPAGTGNDLARTLCLPLDAPAAIAAIDEARSVAMDAIRCLDASGELVGYGLNAAVGGEPARENEALDSDVKRTLGPLALLIGQPKAMWAATAQNVQVTFDDRPSRAERLLGVVVANGRTVGGGVPVAPDADPSDGLLDVMLVGEGDPLQLGMAVVSMLVSRIDDHPLVEHVRCSRVTLSCAEGMPFNLDGDLVGEGSFTFEVVPRAARLCVGPNTPCLPSIDHAP